MVLDLSSQGHSEREIGGILKVSDTTVHKDLVYLRKEALENLKTHIEHTLPAEYQKCMIGINQVLQKAWEIVNKTLDERVRLQALALIDQCNSHKMDMVTNGSIVSDALSYVNGKAEKLESAAATGDKFGAESARNEEEEEEDTTTSGIF